MDIKDKIKSYIKDMSFIIKKTHRVAIALSVLSNCLLKQDPFYVSLRTASLELIAHTSSFPKKSLTEKEISFGVIEDILSRVQKELFALFSSGDISENNFENIDSAIAYILEELSFTNSPYKEESMSFPGAGSLARDLFDKNWLSQEHSASLGERTARPQKEVKDMSFKKVKTSALSESQSGSNGHGKNEKTERINKILSFIKDKGEISVKDIQSVVSGVASKTIQRDLQELIDGGYVRKEGKRRWAKYHYTK